MWGAVASSSKVAFYSFHRSLNSKIIPTFQPHIKRSFLQQVEKLSTIQPTSLVASSDTIYAICTAPGRGAIAIIRVSGPHSSTVYHSLCPDHLPPKPRQATLRRLHDPCDPRKVIDSASVILYYPAPNSATGEDILELNIHGGHATQKAVLSAISGLASLKKLPMRYAEPGEFTKRAFFNSKLDLGQIEALSDEISAETEQQRQAAVRGNTRKLGRIYENWREKLLHARGEIEALIDFAEDQNFEETPKALLESVANQVDLILSETRTHIFASYRGERLKRGINITLLGPPNFGKSTLLNRIIGREASIVSQEAGTTRDVIEARIDLKGYLCTFADTAGIRNKSSSGDSLDTTIGPIEQEGIKRAIANASKSDILIIMASINRTKSSDNWTIQYDELPISLAHLVSKALIIVNKCDLIPSQDRNLFLSKLSDFEIKVSTTCSPEPPPPIIPISCYDCPNDIENYSRNIQKVLDELVKMIKSLTELPLEMCDLVGVTERQRLHLESFCSHLKNFKIEKDIVLAAENLRLAANCLSRITGRGDAGDVEELLGVIFEKYHP